MIKKAFIPLVILSSLHTGVAASTILYTNDNPDITLEQYISNSGNWDSITTPGNQDFTLKFDNTDIYLKLDTPVYFNQITIGSNLPATYTIDFGTNGRLNTSGAEINFGTNVTHFNLTASVSADALAELNKGEIITRTLMYGATNWGIWNFSDRGTKSISLNGIEGYTFIGQITNSAELQQGEYGYIYNDSDNSDTVELAIAGLSIPEPKTTTLILLGVAALLFTRRRR